MKFILVSLVLLFSFSSFAQEKAYWIESHYCGEIDPILVGDACILELNNNRENFAILLSYSGSTEALKRFAVVVLDKKHLKGVTMAQMEVIRGHLPHGVRAFAIESEYVTFREIFM